MTSADASWRTRVWCCSAGNGWRRPCRKIVCKATALTADQRQFWADFYREAFAEFALHNNLDEVAL